MAAQEWVARTRHYEQEKHYCSQQPVSDHPLRVGKVLTVDKSSKAPKPAAAPKDDPLTVTSKGDNFDGLDPLSMFVAEEAATRKTPSSVVVPTVRERDDSLSGMRDAVDSGDDDTFEPWSSKKTGILAKYTTSEKLSITTSFLSSSDKDKIVIKQQTTVVDKVKHRLEQLDDFEEGSVKEMLNLSQQDYVKRIEELNQALISAWESDQRVKALKIAIQCAKLLADTSVIQFYPSKFVLVTDILDTFGRLVYERLHRKSSMFTPGSSVPVMLPEKFTPDQVPQSAKETCRNWFYKIASIRELVPRFYVEIAILKCYNFLTQGEFSQALVRLTKMLRGVGDPLVAIYARCYICRVGILVAPDVKEHLIENLYSFITCYKQLQSDTVQNTLAVQRLEMHQYLQLYPPALDWVLQCVAHGTPESTLTDILERCKEECNSALLLNSIILAFKPEYITQRALLFTDLIKNCEEAGFPKHHLYRSLGLNLIICDPPEEQKLPILSEVWKVVMKLKNPGEYISCAEVWVEYPCRHFTKREINTLIGDVIKHMLPDRAFEQFYPQLLSIVSKILDNVHDFSVLVSMDKFLPFLDMFQKESIKVDACKMIMEAFVKYQHEPTTDPMVQNALMFVCKTLHDSVNALTMEDERRVIGNLITGYLKKTDFGRDFEKQLDFYVDTRASFSNLDAVLVTLVQRVNFLAMRTRDIVKGNHSRKTASFVRACAAYCFITIPSIEDIFTKLQLYLYSGQVALANQALSQADSFFKAAISLVPDVPRNLEVDSKLKASEPYLINFLNNFLSTLLVVPDNPETGVLYLVRGLLDVVTDFSWELNSDAKMSLYLNAICLLSAMCQDTYLYHIDKVDSNDKLYGGDKKFIAEVCKTVATLTEAIFEHLKTLTSGEGLKRQAAIALGFFNRLICHADLTNPELMTLAQNLWNLAQKHGYGGTKYMVRTLDYIKQRGGSGHPGFADLARKMPLQTRT
ncbi:VPS35 endosomal protein-sorting factor-like isoform X2 [Nematostella vectensis]|uniref:VPS35 endosomal protein-sorting factor-like isoform X2 n=1 Tax=Nematostella vectensis TaxID=45351 RepID=UPI0013901010|nr:VPS35 endosomal protein-sorting factor-like isoform X2 [Nematostella vectensis]